MFQTVQGQKLYVVDLPEVPKVPTFTGGGDTELARYATALNDAILTGIIKEPGKYGIAINYAYNTYNIFAIKE